MMAKPEGPNSASRRVKRDEWSQFAETFSMRNQFRPIDLSGTAVPPELHGTPLLYLLGVRYKTAPPPDEFQLVVTKAQDPYVGFRGAAIRKPKTVSVWQDAGGNHAKLSVAGEGAKRVTFELHGELSDSVRRDVTAKIAYQLYERNGRIPGRDFENWGEAERLVRDIDRLVDEGFV